MAGLKCKLFGIPVAVEPSFVVIVALLGLGGRSLTCLAIWVPVLIVSVLAHELGHAVACRAFGQRPRILLQGLSGLTLHAGTVPWGQEIVISLAGPLTGLALGAPALIYEHASRAVASPWGTAVRIVVFVTSHGRSSICFLSCPSMAGMSR